MACLEDSLEDSLELMQNAAARLLTAVAYIERIMPILKQCNGMTVCFFVQIQVAGFHLQSHKWLGPGYLNVVRLPCICSSVKSCIIGPASSSICGGSKT